VQGTLRPLFAAAVSCGGMHTAAVTADGRLYCWGRADNGQLGIGRQWLEASDAERTGVGQYTHERGSVGRAGARVVSASMCSSRFSSTGASVGADLLNETKSRLVPDLAFDSHHAFCSSAMPVLVDPASFDSPVKQVGHH
jgi:hypothetical protein